MRDGGLDGGLRLALPGWAPPALAGLSAALLLACAAGTSRLPAGRDEGTDRLRRMLDLERPEGAAAWWTTVLLLLLAAAAWGRVEQARELGRPREKRRWAVLAGLVAWASFDHAVRAHEAFARAAARVAPELGRIEPLSLVLALLVVVVWLPLLRSARAVLRPAALAGSVLFVLGDLLVDLAVGLVGGAAHPLAAKVVEAGCTWAGLVLLLAVVARPVPWSAAVVDAVDRP